MFKLFKWCFSHVMRATVALALIYGVILLCALSFITTGLLLILIVPAAILLAWVTINIWFSLVQKKATRLFEEGETDMLHDYIAILCEKMRYTPEGPELAIRYAAILLERGKAEKAYKVLTRYEHERYDELSMQSSLSYYNNLTQVLLKNDRVQEAAEAFDTLNLLLEAYTEPVSDIMQAAFALTEAELRLMQGDAAKANEILESIPEGGTLRRQVQRALLKGKILLALEKPEDAAKALTFVLETGKGEPRRVAEKMMQV